MLRVVRCRYAGELTCALPTRQWGPSNVAPTKMRSSLAGRLVLCELRAAVKSQALCSASLSVFRQTRGADVSLVQPAAEARHLPQLLSQPLTQLWTEGRYFALLHSAVRPVAVVVMVTVGEVQRSSSAMAVPPPARPRHAPPHPQRERRWTC